MIVIKIKFEGAGGWETLKIVDKCYSGRIIVVIRLLQLFKRFSMNDSRLPITIKQEVKLLFGGSLGAERKN